MRTPPGTPFPWRDAGFIKFFFDELDYRQHYSGPNPSISVNLTFDYNQFDEMELHLVKPGHINGHLFGDMSFWNNWLAYYCQFSWFRERFPGSSAPKQDWGVHGEGADNPFVYAPDWDEGPQSIYLIDPADIDVGRYKVIVDFDSNWGGDDQGEALIDVYVDNRHVGPCQYRSGLQAEGALWQPVEIDMPSGRVIYGNRFLDPSEGY